jgi:hypothetical protein
MARQRHTFSAFSPTCWTRNELYRNWSVTEQARFAVRRLVFAHDRLSRKYVPIVCCSETQDQILLVQSM